MTAEEFTDEQLRIVRREFYRPPMTEKQFFQERRVLLQAITEPARYLNERGVKAPPSLYRKVLATVLSGIRQHAKRAEIHRFAVYFLHAVQKHMQHHGDGYYYSAKEVRGIGTMLPGAVRNLKPGEADEASVFNEVLVQTNRAVRSKGGRKKNSTHSRAFDGDLFELAGTQSASS